MLSGENSSAWGQLVSLTDLDSAPVEITRAKFTIGRAKGCDLSFSTNKLVSGNHCHIERDGDGQVWLCDTSTNGTLLNLAEKLQKDRRQLTHGDEFYVVFKKSNEDLNVGFMFQDLDELEKEAADATLDYSDELDSTLIDTDTNEVSDHESRKRTQPERGESPLPVTKRRKTEEATTSESDTQLTSQERPGNTQLTNQERPGNTQLTNQERPGNTQLTNQERSGNTHLTNQEKSGDTDLTNQEKSGDPQPTNQGKSGDVDGEVTETKDENPETKDDKKDETKEIKSDGRDGIEETLMCIICQEILHDCISLQPCLHSFCAGCYSDWMSRSNECPSCRMKVQRINRNHMVNNLVEAYLKEHPDKKRPDEDIKELDAKNKITRDMLYPKHDRRYSDDSDEEENSDYLSDSGSPDIVPGGFHTGGFGGGTLFGLGTPLYGAIPAARILCRQCPGYKDTASGSTGTTAAPGGASSSDSGGITAGTSSGAALASDQPSTSGTSTSSTNQTPDDIKTMPTPPPYQCLPNQNHVLCACCLQPMPDRRHGPPHIKSPAVPPISCVICYRNYCHAYWGCRKADCLGCFSKFGDMNFGKKSLVNILLDNGYESQVLIDYLESKSISVKEMLKVCLTKMERGEYVCQDQARYNLTAQTWLCYTCGLRNFKGLAYYYRRDIPRDQLPDTVKNRPDCYWGKNCRTQKNKPHHAQRFNHICDQSRTM